MRRILSLLLVLILLCGLMPTVAFAESATSGTCGDNLVWALSDDGTLTISGEGEMAVATEDDGNGTMLYPWAEYKD